MRQKRFLYFHSQRIRPLTFSSQNFNTIYSCKGNLPRKYELSTTFQFRVNEGHVTDNHKNITKRRVSYSELYLTISVD